jgi:hypothetical protein
MQICCQRMQQADALTETLTPFFRNEALDISIKRSLGEGVCRSDNQEIRIPTEKRGRVHRNIPQPKKLSGRRGADRRGADRRSAKSSGVGHNRAHSVVRNNSRIDKQIPLDSCNGSIGLMQSLGGNLELVEAQTRLNGTRTTESLDGTRIR